MKTIYWTFLKRGTNLSVNVHSEMAETSCWQLARSTLIALNLCPKVSDCNFILTYLSWTKDSACILDTSDYFQLNNIDIVVIRFSA